MRISNLRIAILICALGAMSESLFYTALAPMLTVMDDELGFARLAAVVKAERAKGGEGVRLRRPKK
mgnify:CR=1 FL=1